MKNIYNLFLFLICFSSFKVQSQLGIGTNSPSPSAQLELNSIDKGLLIPRLTTSQRNSIASPANGLIIYNTSSSALQIYKASIPGWIQILDNTPVSSGPNTAPVASSLNYSGVLIEGKTIEINYTYTDAQNDPEGFTTIQWQRATSSSGANLENINGASSSSYLLSSSDANKYVRVLITPRASSGVLNGAVVQGSFFLVEPAYTPTAINISVIGNTSQGETLTGDYDYSGGTGVESTNPTSPSLYIWQSATSNSGASLATAPLYGAQNHTTTFIPQSDMIGRFIRFGIRARDANTGVIASNYVFSPWVGPISLASEVLPIASNVNFSPNPGLDLNLLATYSYFDANGDPESGSSFQWYTATDANGSNQTLISGATNISYIPVSSDLGKFIGFGVKPKAATGNTGLGNEVIYYSQNSTVNNSTFTFTGNYNHFPFFTSNRVMNQENVLRIEVNVTSVGSANFTSTIVNGYQFSLNTIFSTTGIQWVTLNSIGFKSSYNSLGDNFIITGVGSTTITLNVNIKNSNLGSEITLTNGTSPFSYNVNCYSNIISYNYTSTSCNGSLTIGSNSYNLVHINGQCWMGKNLAEIPNTPCSSSPNTGCNVWLNTAPSDLGLWGYYNTSVTSGASGWATSLPLTPVWGPNTGIYYQWSAAMNGSISERSQGVCPSGWHIPSDCEVMYLEHGLGMSIAQQISNSNSRNTGNTGQKLSLYGTGSLGHTGFDLLIGGWRSNSNGSFMQYNNSSYIWTSTTSSVGNTVIRRINNSAAGLERGFASNNNALNVRCIKD